MNVQEIVSAHPDVKGNVNRTLAECIAECYACSQTCLSCADACTAEVRATELVQCIRLTSDCSDVCIATGQTASRRAGFNVPVIRSMLESCALACRLCAEACGKHEKMHEHCRICAESCRKCEKACIAALPTVV
jgi:hypothetical protein